MRVPYCLCVCVYTVVAKQKKSTSDPITHTQHTCITNTQRAHTHTHTKSKKNRDSSSSSKSHVLALKIMGKSDILRLKQLKHIQSEKNILAQLCLCHPFIVNMFGSFQDERYVYMIMEYVVGGELFSQLRSMGTLTNDAARFYSAEIVLAIEYLHSKVLFYHLKKNKTRNNSCYHPYAPRFLFVWRLPSQKSPCTDLLCKMIFVSWDYFLSMQIVFFFGFSKNKKSNQKKEYRVSRFETREPFNRSRGPY